ncbi:MAG: hypothetical protein R3B70_38400 [Polyangiaceae bacterium]
MKTPARKWLSRLRGLLAGTLALLFAPDCTQGVAAESEELGVSALDETPGVVLSAAVWTLAWDTEGVTFASDSSGDGGSGGFEVETDLGYRVTVSSAHLVSHSVSFGACETGTLGSETARGPDLGPLSKGILAWLEGGMPVRSAHAHVEDTDPSTIETSWIEDLTEPRDIEFSTGFTAARYCRAHWLLARPTEATSGAGGVSMANRSLLLTGVFERGQATGAFTIDTWWPRGQLLDLAETMDGGEHEAARRDGGARHAFVTVTRHLGEMFDGIDFEVASQEQIDGRVIDNLVTGTDIEIELWRPGDPT